MNDCLSLSFGSSGGETEFLELLVSHHDQLEPICKECHVVR